jgi:hypothetical protein
MPIRAGSTWSGFVVREERSVLAANALPGWSGNRGDVLAVGRFRALAGLGDRVGCRRLENAL